MPRIQIMDPFGMCYQIATRRVETTLFAWFDEVLPYCYLKGRPGIDNFSVEWPKINVHPMWAWKRGPLEDPDWVCDSRVIGGLYPFPAGDGKGGLCELLNLRTRLEAELRTLDAGRRC